MILSIAIFYQGSYSFSIYTPYHQFSVWKIVCGMFHFRFRFILIKVYIFAQQQLAL